MPSLTIKRSAKRRTSRRLLKLASLGLAGLLAGLLSGCNSSTDSPFTAIYTHPSPVDTLGQASSNLPENIEARQIPALHHPPSTRRLRDSSLTIPPQPTAINYRSRS